MLTDSPYIDELSGCYNQQYLKEEKDEELRDLVTKGIPFSVAMVGINDFNNINETYGNDMGNEIIRQFSRFLRKTLRASDTVVRYGGDVFVAIMSHASRSDIEAVLWRMLTDSEDREFGGLKIAINIGIASFPEDGRTLVRLIQVADDALTQVEQSRHEHLGAIRRKKIILPTRIFVDRTAETENLRGLLSDNEKNISVAIVTGRHGVGKTRLVREVLNGLHGYEVIWSNCPYRTEGDSFSCIREAIRYRLRRRGMDLIEAIPLAHQSEIAKLLPEIIDHIKAKVRGVTHVLDKYRLYEGITKIFEIGENKKICVFDDVQWIDRASIEVIKHVFDTIQDSYLRIVFIYRIEEMSSEVEELIAYVTQDREAHELILCPLGHDETKSMLTSIIDGEPDDRLTEYVIRESGGNPLFIEEIMRTLYESRYLGDFEGFWRFREPEEELVPKNIEEIASAKYQCVSADARHIAEIASIIRWFDIPMLMKLTEYPEPQIIALFDELRRAGILRSSDERHEFVEDMCRDFIYKKTRGIRSIQVHRKICRYLEQERNVQKTCQDLAYHSYRGMDKDNGVKYCIMAGEMACDRYANRDAIRYFGWALELLFNEHSIEHIKTRIDCLARRAKVYLLIGEHENALKNVIDGLQLARAMSEQEREATLLCIQAQIYFNTGQYNKTLSLARECYDIYKELPNPQVAAAITLMGDVYRSHGEYEKARQHYEEALALYHRAQDRNGVAQVINNIGMIHFYRDDLMNALKYFKDALVIIHETGNRQFEAVITGNIGSVMNELGNHHVALQYFEDALVILQEIGLRISEGYFLGQSGWACIHLGNYAQAIEYLDGAIKIFKEISNTTMEALYLDALGRVYGDKGDFNKASYYCRTAQIILRDRGIKWHYFANTMNRAYLSIERNDLELAKVAIDDGMTIGEEMGLPGLKSRALIALCEWSLLHGNTEIAKRALLQLRKAVENTKSRFVINMNTLLWGRYSGLTGNYRDAHAYLERALKDCLELEEKLMGGKIQYYLGDLYIAQGNQVSGKEYIQKAMDTFTAIGAQVWARKSEEILGSLT